MGLLLVIAASAIAADPELGPDKDRYVADAIEVVTLPNGNIVTRLISRDGTTARQFWVDSVYGQQQSILAFPGKGSVMQEATAATVRQTDVQRMTRNFRTPNEEKD